MEAEKAVEEEAPVPEEELDVETRRQRNILAKEEAAEKKREAYLADVPSIKRIISRRGQYLVFDAALNEHAVE